MYSIRERSYGIRRVEIDFSLASFNAVAKTFTGNDYEQFLQSMWDALMEDTELEFVIHICRIHVLRFLKFKIHEVYKIKRHEEVFKVLRAWTYRMVRVSNMSELVNLVEEVLTLVGNKYQTSTVEDAKSGLRNSGKGNFLVDLLAAYEFICNKTETNECGQFPCRCCQLAVT